MPRVVEKANCMGDHDTASKIRIDIVETFAHSMWIFPSVMVDYFVQSHHSLLDVCWDLLSNPVQRSLSPVYRVIGQFLSCEDEGSSTMAMNMI